MSSSDDSSAASSQIMDDLTLQEMLYLIPVTEKPCPMAIDTMKRSVKKIFRDVKFPSETGKAFEKPNFVHPYKRDENGKDQRIQAVDICESLMKKMSEFLIMKELYFFMFVSK